MNFQDFKVGDRVKLNCPSLLGRDIKNSTEGTIVEIFDALNQDGSPGNFEIDIRHFSGWIRYKPQKDGGTLTLVKKEI